MSNLNWALAALDNPKPRKPLPVVPTPIVVPVVPVVETPAAKDPAAMLASALELVKAAGFRVTAPKAVNAQVPRPTGLNAIGRPYSALFDPKYKMKYRAPRRVACVGTSTAASNNACSVYREAMERKHAGNPALLAEILGRVS